MAPRGVKTTYCRVDWWGRASLGLYLTDRNPQIATNVNRAAYFRWTPRTARLTFIFAVAVPSVLLYAGYQTDVSCFPCPPPVSDLSYMPKRDWRCDRRGAPTSLTLGLFL